MELPHGLLGSAIKSARLEKNLTQEGLAEIIDITPMHMKQIESERRKPSVDVLFRIVYALDFSLDSLFSTNKNESNELRDKINFCLNQCNEYKLRVVYATAKALLRKEK